MPPQDIIGNDDTLESTGRAYFGDRIDDAHLAATQNHPLYRHIRRLNQIRRAIPALQKAPMSQLAEWGCGLSFVRDWNQGESYAIVGLTIGGGQDIQVGGVRDGLYRDAVTGDERQAQGGNLSFHVKANSAGIYVLEGPGKLGEDGPYLR